MQESYEQSQHTSATPQTVNYDITKNSYNEDNIKDSSCQLDESCIANITSDIDNSHGDRKIGVTEQAKINESLPIPDSKANETNMVEGNYEGELFSGKAHSVPGIYQIPKIKHVEQESNNSQVESESPMNAPDKDTSPRAECSVTSENTEDLGAKIYHESENTISPQEVLNTVEGETLEASTLRGTSSIEKVQDEINRTEYKVVEKVKTLNEAHDILNEKQDEEMAVSHEKPNQLMVADDIGTTAKPCRKKAVKKAMKTDPITRTSQMEGSLEINEEDIQVSDSMKCLINIESQPNCKITSQDEKGATISEIKYDKPEVSSFENGEQQKQQKTDNSDDENIKMNLTSISAEKSIEPVDSIYFQEHTSPQEKQTDSEDSSLKHLKVEQMATKAVIIPISAAQEKASSSSDELQKIHDHNLGSEKYLSVNKEEELQEHVYKHAAENYVKDYEVEKPSNKPHTETHTEETSTHQSVEEIISDIIPEAKARLNLQNVEKQIVEPHVREVLKKQLSHLDGEVSSGTTIRDTKAVPKCVDIKKSDNDKPKMINDRQEISNNKTIEEKLTKLTDDEKVIKNEINNDILEVSSEEPVSSQSHFVTSETLNVGLSLEKADGYASNVSSFNNQNKQNDNPEIHSNVEDFGSLKQKDITQVIVTDTAKHEIADTTGENFTEAKEQLIIEKNISSGEVNEFGQKSVKEPLSMTRDLEALNFILSTDQTMTEPFDDNDATKQTSIDLEDNFVSTKHVLEDQYSSTEVPDANDTLLKAQEESFASKANLKDGENFLTQRDKEASEYDVNEAISESNAETPEQKKRSSLSSSFEEIMQDLKSEDKSLKIHGKPPSFYEKPCVQPKEHGNVFRDVLWDVLSL